MSESTTEQLRHTEESEFAAFVAIDWADQEHAWALQDAGNGRREQGKLAQMPEAIEAWATGLADRFQGRPIAVALEQARGALVYALSKYKHLVLYPIHPSTSSKYRAAMFPSGAKDDPKDAELLLELLLYRRNRLRALQPDTSSMRQLQVLVEKRRQLVNQKTAFTNRITDQLKQYFPQILQWFDDVDSPLVTAFLQCWPTLQHLQAATAEQILALLHRHNSRSQARNQQRLEQIPKARPLTLDAAIVEPARLMVETLLELVQVLRTGITKLEKQIEQICAEQPDFAIFNSFPGAAKALAPRLLAAFGSRRERYTSASQVQTYSGIAPVISRSGKSVWIHARHTCPKFLRQTFHEYAAQSLGACHWARAFYDKQRAKGKGRHAAIRSLAFKWIRILFRCWQDRVPYSEQRALERRAPRPAPSEKTVEFVWESVVEFSKFSIEGS